VAERLHVSPSMVRAWCGQGRFPHAVKGGQTLHAHWEIPEADLDQAGIARDSEAPLCAESGEALSTEGGETLSAAQVARRLGVSVSTVRVWCRKGQFPGATQRRKERGAPWQIPEEDLPTLS
jgi:predicted site-specific integrase-resolvase